MGSRALSVGHRGESPIRTAARTEAFVSAALAAVAATLLVTLLPMGGDAPAHLYRTLLVEKGVFVWDNLWFGGSYPLASYSVLYYLPAAVVGNVPLVIAATVASAALFASLALREWGDAARWPARVFGALASGPLFTGTYTYALGLAALLATLRSLQAGRPWLAVAFAALTLGFSPLAFTFLVLALLALVLTRRGPRSRTLALALGIAALAAAEVALLLLFPSGGTYPFRIWNLFAVLVVAGLAAYLAWRSPSARVLAAFFCLWGLASLAAYLVPSPFGENVARLRALVFPLVLLTAFLVRFRPRRLVVLAVLVALADNIIPYAALVPNRAAAADRRLAHAQFWQPMFHFLRERSTPDYRVEVVPTSGHWESYWLPRAGFALARGWYRQLDIAENPVFYESRLGARAYRRWLRSLGIRYVLLPRVGLAPMGAWREARLLRSGRSGLVRVYASRDWTVWELPDPSPILTGPGKARLTQLGHQRIAGVTSAPGVYRLRVRYTPYFRVHAGTVCTARAADGMTRLVVRVAGRFVIATAQGPADLLERARGCAAARPPGRVTPL